VLLLRDPSDISDWQRSTLEIAVEGSGSRPSSWRDGSKWGSDAGEQAIVVYIHSYTNGGAMQVSKR
jgi:hypothetical protein